MFVWLLCDLVVVWAVMSFAAWVLGHRLQPIEYLWGVSLAALLEANRALVLLQDGT